MTLEARGGTWLMLEFLQHHFVGKLETCPQGLHIPCQGVGTLEAWEALGDKAIDLFSSCSQSFDAYSRW